MEIARSVKYNKRGASEALRRRFFAGTAFEPVRPSDDPESRSRTYEAGNPDGTPARKYHGTRGIRGWGGGIPLYYTLSPI